MTLPSTDDVELTPVTTAVQSLENGIVNGCPETRTGHSASSGYRHSFPRNGDVTSHHNHRNTSTLNDGYERTHQENTSRSSIHLNTHQETFDRPCSNLNGVIMPHHQQNVSCNGVTDYHQRKSSEDERATTLRQPKHRSNNHVTLNGEPSSSGESPTKLYGSRWVILAVVCLLNMSNAMMWITFAAAADTTIAFYGISPFQLNMLSMVFLIAMVPLGPAATWFLDTFGLRPTLLLSAWLTAIGGLLRNISTMDFIAHDAKYTVLLIGQITAACGQPLVMFAPTKLAAVWFPEKKRALANSIGSMSLSIAVNPMGNLMAFFIVPLVAETAADIPLALWIVSSPAFLTAILVTAFVRRSRPPTPPSISAGEKSEPFLAGLVKLLRNKDYIILNLCFGAGMALYTSLASFMEQILCPRGYTALYSGVVAGSMIAVGCLMSAIAGVYVDKTKRYDEVLKISYAMAALAGILFTQVSRMHDQTVSVALAAVLFGAFGLVIYPISMELAVEISYPVAEATSSGLCIVSGQIQGIAYMFAMQYLVQPLPEKELELETGCQIPENNATALYTPQDWTYSNLYILNVISTVGVVALILFFRPKYKRLIAEGVLTEHPLQANQTATEATSHSNSKPPFHIS